MVYHQQFHHQWTNYWSGWKERIFILKGPILYYYYEKNELPRGKIHLGLSVINTEEDSDVIIINTGSNIFYVKAENKEEKDKWVRALKLAKLEGEKSIREAIKKAPEAKNDEYKDMIIPELNDPNFIDINNINIAVTKLNMDNQSAINGNGTVDFEIFANFYEYVAFIYPNDDVFRKVVESEWL